MEIRQKEDIFQNTEHYDRVWAQIDLSALRFNMASMKRNLKEGVMMTAVLKTNGYGHGSCVLARELEKLPYMWGFAVATFEEALELRLYGIKKPILLLGYVFPYCYPQLAEYEIRPACFREDMLEELSGAAMEAGREIRIHIACDTGMTRIGIRPDASGLSFVRKALNTPGLIVEGMFTHFARADMPGRESTLEQLEKFTAFSDQITEKLHYRIPIVHASNSAGIIEYPEANLDMVRAGITLYGLWPSEDVRKDVVPLRPLLSLYSHIVMVKDVPEDVGISYGGTYVTKGESTRIATIPVGYGDGYPRSLSNKGYVLIHGMKAPIAGRVCMDQFMVDVSDIPEAKDGDPVTLIGTDGGETITAEMLGDLSGRFNYELTCDLNRRVPRVYINGSEPAGNE